MEPLAFCLTAFGNMLPRPHYFYCTTFNGESKVLLEFGSTSIMLSTELSYYHVTTAISQATNAVHAIATG